MEFRLLHYFIAVAEELNVTRAATRLGTTQPSLSQNIRQLETLVGTPLFSREKHRLQLTEAGRVFLEEVRAIVDHMDRAVAVARRAARAEAGQIRIGLLPGVEGKLFSRVVPILLRNYPDVQIIFRTLSSPEQELALQNHEINVGFLRGPIRDNDITSEVFAREKILAILPAKHPFAEKDRVSLQMLSSLPLIQMSRAYAPTAHDAMHATAARAGIHFRTLFETENLLTTLNAIAAGLGFSLLAEYVREILPKSVVARPLDLNPEPEIELLVAYRSDDRLPALAFFLSLLRDSTAKPAVVPNPATTASTVAT